jgi:undecaprenyl-diphosphatase
MFESILRWDRETFVYLNNLGIEKYDTFWLVITQTVTWIPLFILIVYLIHKNYGFQRAKIVMKFYFIAVFMGIALMLLTKYTIGRIRPSNIPELEGLIRMLHSSQSFSFYSGHASSSFLIATFAVLVLRKFHNWVYVFILFPLLFSWSRIHVGVHYPSDLIFGAIIGILLAFFFYRKLKTNLELK